MENNNNNYNSNTPRTSQNYEANDSKTGWLIGGGVALALVLGIAYYNSNDRNDLRNIEPAAGTSVEGNRQVPQRDMDSR